MAVTAMQKQNMVKRGMDLARQLADWNKAFNAFNEEYVAEDYGNASSGITDAVLTAYNLSTGLTNADFTSGIGAMDTVSTSVETNKTNIYKITSGNV